MVLFASAYPIRVRGGTFGERPAKPLSIQEMYIPSDGGLIYAAKLVPGSGLVWQAITPGEHTHNATDITAGTLAVDRIPSLPASIITSGQFDAARIPEHSAALLTSGTLDTSVLPIIPLAKGGLGVDTSGWGNAIPIKVGGVFQQVAFRFNQPSDPTASEGISAGYSIGSQWFTTSGKIWLLVDPTDSAAIWVDITASAGGTVTSVGLNAPSDLFTVSSSPVTGSGTLTLAKVNQLQNLVYASPAASTGAPLFRSLVAADIPTLPATQISQSGPVTGATVQAAIDTLQASKIQTNDTRTLTNKTIDADGNSISNIGADEVKPDLIGGLSSASAVDTINDRLMMLDATDGSLKQFPPNLLPGGGAEPLEFGEFTGVDSGNYSSSSTTFEDVHSTEMAITLTTPANGVVQVGFSGSIVHSINNASVMLDVDVDGSRIGGSNGILASLTRNTTPGDGFSFVRLIPGLSEGSHTFKLQWRLLGGTMTMFTGVIRPQFWAVVIGAAAVTPPAEDGLLTHAGDTLVTHNGDRLLIAS